MKGLENGQDWYYQSPVSRKKKPEKVLVPPPSQIPGLSFYNSDDKNNKISRGTIRATDSKYIRLAKQGGRPNLLQFQLKEQVKKEPVPYPRVDWFDHNQMTHDEEKQILRESSWVPPDYIVHENVKDDFTTKSKKKFNKIESKDEENVVETPKMKQQNKQEIIPKQQTRKPDVSFNKLISGGYGHDWLDERKKAHEKQLQKWSLARLDDKMRKKRHKNINYDKFFTKMPVDTKLWTLNRFNKAKPKVVTGLK